MKKQITNNEFRLAIIAATIWTKGGMNIDEANKTAIAFIMGAEREMEALDIIREASNLIQKEVKKDGKNPESIPSNREV